MTRWPVLVVASTLALSATAVGVHLAAGGETSMSASFVVPFAVMSIVGGIIVRSRPGNGVGLLLLFVGACGAAWLAATAYMDFSAGRADLPAGARLAAWLTNLLWIPPMMSVATLLLVFPSGRPVGVWRWVLGVLAVVWTASFAFLAAALIPVPFETLYANASTVASPIPAYEWFDETVTATFFLLGVPLGLASQVGRWRRGDPVERQQVKWVVFAAILVLGAVIVSEQVGSDSLTSELMWTLGLTALPIAVGIAVVRYRLYDIDRIVGRTISYAIVLGVLTLVFIGLVGTPVLTLGSGEAPPWLVAASTLVVFALFNPLRRRVQRVVDRRFNRSPYDPEQVSGSLAASLRTAVAVPSIAGAWEETARSALQPASSAVWMKDRT